MNPKVRNTLLVASALGLLTVAIVSRTNDAPGHAKKPPTVTATAVPTLTAVPEITQTPGAVTPKATPCSGIVPCDPTPTWPPE